MVLYRYVKKKKNPYYRIVFAISHISIILGAIFLFWSFYPIVSYKIYSLFFLQKAYSSPIPISSINDNFLTTRGSTNIFSTNLSDYTKVAAWFPSASEVYGLDKISIKSYIVSIPKLGITDAKVLIGEEDLTKGLVHYLPKVAPGRPGKIIILGHSTHPALYSTNGPNRYKSIFTYLPTLVNGDVIQVTADGKDYEYSVIEKYEVQPQETWVLDQRYDDSYLTLITCTPPGTVERRAIINAKLKSNVILE